MNTTLKKNETRRERFIRIVERRVNNILDGIDNLGKCSNQKNYEYDEEDVKKIFNEIEKKIKEVKSMYQDSHKEKQKFKLIDKDGI